MSTPAPDPSDPAPPGDVPPEGPAPGGPPTPPQPDRRTRADRRGKEDRRKVSIPVPFERRQGGDRRASPDRRDGKRAGEYDLDPDALEFIQAINTAREARNSGFLSWSDVLAIVKSLGYAKRPK